MLKVTKKSTAKAKAVQVNTVNRAFVALISALLIATLASFAANAQAPGGQGQPQGNPMRPQTVQFTGGVGLITSNDYRGADNARFIPIPFGDIRYDRFFFNPGVGLGANVVSWNQGKWRYQLDLAIAPQFANRDASDVPGVDALEIGVEGRAVGRLSYENWTLQVQGGHALFETGTNGGSVEVGLLYGDRFGRGGIWSIGPNFVFVDDNTAQSLYRVTPRESRASGLDVFRTTGGLESVNLQGFLNYPLGGRWFALLTLNAGFLTDKYEASPIVETRFQGTLISAITYRF